MMVDAQDMSQSFKKPNLLYQLAIKLILDIVVKLKFGTEPS